MSFSRDIRQELLKQTPKSLSERQALLGGLFLSEAPGDLRYSCSFSSSDEDLRDYAVKLVSLAGFSCDTASSRISISSSSLSDFTACYDMCFAPQSADILSASPEFVRGFLKGVFLNCGYFSDPDKTYRVELHVRNPHVVSLIIWLLHGNDIEPTVSARGATSVIRIRNGDAISTFLALIGAVSSLFEFENIRVSREVKGNVNRVVNCDSGNARRQADAGARRTELFLRLLASPESASLPKELLTAARLHIENPGLSITELGRLMDPPISKSGMNHRLIKLEEIARDL